MRRYFAIGFLTGLLLVLTACDPQKGQACDTPGKTWAKHGTVLHCKPNHHTGEYTWQ